MARAVGLTAKMRTGREDSKLSPSVKKAGTAKTIPVQRKVSFEE